MALPKLKDITWVTTDCYGTLIDWEKGILDAFNAEADRDGFSFDEEPFIKRFLEVQAEIMSGSYELYAEVLRRTAVKVAGEIGWELEPSRAQFVPDSVARWLPFREANAAMDRLGKRYEVGIISNIDDKLLGVSRRHLRTDLDLVVTAQQVRSYKPDPAHFKEGARRIGGKKGWIHIASGYDADVAPLMKMNVPVIWVNRHGEKLDGRKKPDAEVQELPRRGEEAWRRRLAGSQLRPRGRGDGRAGARAFRRRAPPSGAPAPAGGALGGASEPDRDRRAEVRDDEPAPLPQPPPRDLDVAPEGAQLLRRRAQLGARRPTGTRATSTAARRSAARARRTTPTCRALRASPSGCARCSRDARIVYMVRDPIDRMLSHYLHNVGGGYETRALEEALGDPDGAYVDRSRYAMQVEPYLRAFGPSGCDRLARGARATTARRRCGACSSFCGVDPSFTSEQFEREWETGSAQAGRAGSG